MVKLVLQHCCLSFRMPFLLLKLSDSMGIQKGHIPKVFFLGGGWNCQKGDQMMLKEMTVNLSGREQYHSGHIAAWA